jgi:SPP1 gp7 family putative phage head morphogenesis protein
MKNEKYWKKRQEEKLSSILNDAQVASEYVSDIYSKASLYTQSKINGIFEKYRDGHGLSNADAKEMLDSLISDRDYNQIKRILENNPKTKQRKELLKKLDTPPYQYRIKRLENMQSQLDKLMNEVYKVEKDVSTDCYINSAFNAYYRNVYNLQKGMKVAYQFDMLDPELIDSMLKSRWSGKNYSNRIWDNTNALAESLKDEMLMGVLTNKTEKEMADTIMNKFAVGAYQARRLIQTESAAMTAFADQQAFKDAGIEKEMFIAVHDSRTSQICQHHDRSIVEIAKAKVGVNVPPLHPNCRSHMIPYIEGVTDAMKKRQRNPVTNKDEVVDVSENYDQWLKRQQEEHGVDTVNSFMEKTKNASSDRKQYNKYIDVLGKENMPTSLSKFQDMKYNDVEKFNDLKLHFKDSKLQKGITESYNLTLREGQQGKRILGHNNYLEGRSYIVDASMKDIQECIKKHAGNGTINRYRNGDWDNTESIVDNSIVGYVLSIDKTWIATNKFKIHYSKEKGTHMVPTLKGVKKND